MVSIVYFHFKPTMYNSAKWTFVILYFKKNRLTLQSIMTRKILYLLLAIVFVSCSMKPLGIIGEEKMENIIYDLTITDAIVDTYGSLISNEERQQLYDDIFDRYGINKEKFARSLDWYAHHPKRIEFVCAKVKERIDNLRTDVETYKLRPDAEIEAKARSLDTIDIYHFEPSYSFNSTPNDDSLRFEINDPTYFAVGDRFILRLIMNVENIGSQGDTLKSSHVELIVTYADGSKRALQQPIIANKKRYRYIFMPIQRSDVAPIKVEGHLFASNDLVRSIKIDSVHLYRIFDPKLNPLPESVRLALKLKAEDSDPNLNVDRVSTLPAERIVIPPQRQYVDIKNIDVEMKSPSMVVSKKASDQDKK